MRTPETIQFYADASGVLRYASLIYYNENGENGEPECRTYALGEQVASREAHQASARGQVMRVQLLYPREVKWTQLGTFVAAIGELGARGHELTGPALRRAARRRAELHGQTQEGKEPTGAAPRVR